MNPAADWITQIVDVDPEEAQILIDLVELLFEDWYVARNDRTKHLAKIRSIAEEKKQKQEPAQKLDDEMPEFSGPNVEVTSETKHGGLRRTLRRCRTVRRACMFSSDDAQHSVSGTRGITVNLRQCLLLIATLWPVSAFSASGDTFFTGDMLHRYCNQSSESCTNYIAGVVDALIAVGATQKTPLICLHDRTELGQAVDVIANYLRAHPREAAWERRGHRHYSFEARVPL